MKKILALLLAAAMMICLFAACTGTKDDGDKVSDAGNQSDAPEDSGDPGAEDDGTVYEFNVSFAAPEFSTTEITAALDRIQEASNGRIVFTYYYSWSLTSVATVVDDMNAGICDIAAIAVNEHLNLFPYSNLVTYTPFLGLPDMIAAAQIFDELYADNAVLQDEYTNLGLHYWTNYPCPGYNIFTTSDHAITTPEDLNGLKLISSSSMMQEFIKANGGAAVTAPVTDYATSLNTNVVDGIINHANVIAAFGCLDFIKAATVFGDQGTAVTLMMMCFAQDSWDALPADLQQLFNDEATALRDSQGAWDQAANQSNLDVITAAGGTVTVLDNAQIQVWRDAFAGNTAAYIQSLSDSGATEAQTLYDALQAKIAAYGD